MPRGDAALARLAARNNAEWCRAVATSHGIASAFTLDGALWVAESPTPVGYPEAVTLEAGLDPSAVLAALARCSPAASSLKDSFADLELGSAGWAPLFEATWVVADAATPATAPISTGTDGSLGLVPVTGGAGLARWGQSHGLPDAFASPLLEAPGVLVLGTAPAHATPAAGGVLNRTGEVVGLSNAFGGGLELYRALRREAGVRWPGLPIVGYESDDALADALAAGFRPLAPLRVWVGPDQPARQTT
ncbi:hypothetical protein [Agromyces sp. NPDC058126]|uniref:hypothetical protein n=1 Tax=Agromyces sp. NPDC058126 TaxID=3346350 RepID=UPI0036D823A0